MDLNEMIGRRVLVGITYVDAHGEAIDQHQFAGIVEADPGSRTVTDPAFWGRVAGSR